jgi:anaerobic magnesium-protoporphyrin IX monomethyl ester cyclase
MKVLLVRPPYERLRGYHPTPYFPLGVGYIGAVLEKAGHEVKIWNADATIGITAGAMPDEVTMLKERRQRFETYQDALRDTHHPVWEQTRSILKDLDPDIVGLSVLSAEVGSAVKFSSLVKENRKERIVVWGGHHPTFLPEDVLSYGVVDIVVRGEGEKSIIDLISALSFEQMRLNEIKGISYLENSAIRHNPEQELIENLDSIPFPGHHLSLFPQDYKRMERIGIITNRGCPFKCGYCSSPTFSQRTVRFRSYDNVIDEIRYVMRFYKKNIVSFLDDNFTINKTRAIKLCEDLIKADLKVSWDTMTRADILNEDVVKLMKQAGCCGLTIGIESGSERILKKINKGVNLNKVVEAYQLLYRYDIPSGANFMAGFPEETLEDIQKTFKMMKRINTMNINFNIFEPIPGSPLLEESKRLGLVPEKVDWRTFGFWPMNHFVKNISQEEFTKIVFNITQWLSDYKSSARVRWMRIKPYIKNDLLYPFRRLLKSIRVRIVKRFIKDF